MQPVSGENIYGIASGLFALPSVAQGVNNPNKNIIAAPLQAMECEAMTDRLSFVLGYELARKLLPKSAKGRISREKKFSLPHWSDLEVELAPYTISLKARVVRPRRA